MRIKLSEAEFQLLNEHDIKVFPSEEYSEDEALEILDEVYDLEASFAQSDSDPDNLAMQFAHIGDKIYDQIPED